MYTESGKLLNDNKDIGSYFKPGGNNKVRIEFYNVLTLKICYTLTKLVTFTDELKTVDDLRNLLVFSEIEEFGDGKLEENSFKQWFLFTYNFAVIPESV